MASSFEAVFTFDARDEDEADAIVELMREAADAFAYVKLDSLSYTYNGTPLLKDDFTDFYDVVLVQPGDRLINAIKEVRSITSLGLKEAKDLVDSTRPPHGHPAYLLREVGESEARKAVGVLESIGATAQIERSRLTKREVDAAKKGLLSTVEFLSNQTERQT